MMAKIQRLDRRFCAFPGVLNKGCYRNMGDIENTRLNDGFHGNKGGTKTMSEQEQREGRYKFRAESLQDVTGFLVVLEDDEDDEEDDEEEDEEEDG